MPDYSITSKTIAGDLHLVYAEPGHSLTILLEKSPDGSLSSMEQVVSFWMIPVGLGVSKEKQFEIKSRLLIWGQENGLPFDFVPGLTPEEVVAKLKDEGYTIKKTADGQVIALPPGIGAHMHGISCLEKGQYEKALSAFNDAIAKLPAHLTDLLAEAYRLRGRTKGALEDYHGALPDFEKSLAIVPSSDAYFQRAVVFAELSKRSEAVADFTRSIELHPQAEAYFNRALSYMQLGRVDLAFADYSHAVELDPKLHLAWLNRGMIHLNRSEFEFALADFENALKAKSDYANAFNNIAWVLATCPDAKYRDGKKAVEYAEKATELKGSQDANTLGTLAAACAEAGDFNRAVLLGQKRVKLAYSAKDLADAKMRVELYQAGRPYRSVPHD